MQKRLSICAVSLKRKKKTSNSPFNECRKLPKVQVGRSRRPQAVNKAGNFFVPSGETKNNSKEDKESEGKQNYRPCRKASSGEGSKEQQ